MPLILLVKRCHMVGKYQSLLALSKTKANLTDDKTNINKFGHNPLMFAILNKRILAQVCTHLELQDRDHPHSKCHLKTVK